MIVGVELGLNEFELGLNEFKLAGHPYRLISNCMDLKSFPQGLGAAQPHHVMIK